ncbi:hypothetical protein CEXT_702541 [Caerostris extrusa]|uniref:Uncharacterized protein n=1 Tax=Caerostris extrusa TaxID=172846 RepID=A0AAV4TDU4_CAEEX|nr:hypothetical protein CEXT_702541 [Caerostris extrusa]
MNLEESGLSCQTSGDKIIIAVLNSASFRVDAIDGHDTSEMSCLLEVEGPKFLILEDTASRIRWAQLRCSA